MLEPYNNLYFLLFLFPLTPVFNETKLGGGAVTLLIINASVTLLIIKSRLETPLLSVPESREQVGQTGILSSNVLQCTVSPNSSEYGSVLPRDRTPKVALIIRWKNSIIF